MMSLPIDIAKWIEDETLPRSTGNFKTLGCLIGNCIPPIFEAYCKIFHPFEVTADEVDVLEPRKKDKRKTVQKNVLTLTDILKWRDEQLKEYKSKRWDFVTWKSISDRYNLVFHNQINPDSFRHKFKKIGWQRNLNFPSEGYLPKQLLIILLDILKSQSEIDEVYIYQMPPHTVWKDNSQDLVKCNYDEVIEYFDSDFRGYLYSSDKSWIVFTDIDLTFTLVGGPKKLIDKLITSELEVLECGKSTRVDDYSDNVNPKKKTIFK